jgi:gluconokinase
MTVQSRLEQMTEFPLRSPTAQVDGLLYFGRMLDKIRVHAKGELPPEYQPNLGKGFDRNCLDLLGIDYQDLVDRVKKGGNDEEILGWCFTRGLKPGANEIVVWNEFMRKRGWNDELSEILARRKKETGLSERSEIQTMFQFIDADEGRLPA